MKSISINAKVNVDKLMEDLEKLTGKSDNEMDGKNMTTTSFINDCVKCIEMCKKEFSNEFAEWMKKIILEEVSGRFETKEGC